MIASECLFLVRVLLTIGLVELYSNAKALRYLSVRCSNVPSCASASSVQAQNAGGLKEWNTDQDVNEESVLDSDAAALKKKAEQEDICVPIGEGENCW